MLTATAIQTVAETLTRDLSQNIEEVIKVNQENEAAVYAEITDYIATDRIKSHYRDLLRAIAESPAEPHEGVGVWVSGFFGSGKSGFVKNLAYALENPTVQGHSAAELFKERTKDGQIGALIDSIHARAPMDAVMFDVRVNSKVLQGAGHITELMYTALLRALGYAEDYEIADLEIELEAEGKLDGFVQSCQQQYSTDWRIVRKGSQKVPRASALLHLLDPTTYPDAESWSRTRQKTDLTIHDFVERAFELVARRRPGKTLLFVLDEVGAYVARSAEKIEDLRALVERFGVLGRNRVKAGKAVAPIWIVVTAQEKLDEVVAAIDSKRVELARLQDRFKFTVDLSPADIREVATRRVLAKEKEAVPALQSLYREKQGQLSAALQLERTSRKCEVREDEFVQFYPYPPHFVDLCIDVMSGIRLQPGAQTQVGGSNRTIIKQAYEMLASDRTAVGRKPFGTLVTLDLVYELVEGLLRSEKQLDIANVRRDFEGHAEDREGWTLRVAKVICLLEFVSNLPRTEKNIAACLVDGVGLPSPAAAVKEALLRLEAAQYIRETEHGWKLQTAHERGWETEKRGYLSPKPRERNEILREALKEVFAEPELKAYRYLGRKNFKTGITVDGTKVGEEGDIPLALVVADDADGMRDKLEAVRADSRQKAHENEVYYVFAMTPDVDGLINRLYASRQMAAKYEALRSQSKITLEESTLLQGEKTEILNIQSRLRERLTAALEQGVGVFRGMDREAASLGSSLGEIVKRQLDFACPELYPKLEMSPRALKGSEAEEVLKAANLNALPAVFHDGDGGLNLIMRGTGGRYVPNPAAEIAREVLDYLQQEHAYGNRVTGKMLDERFTGLGYGWERAVIQLVLAVLLRAGAIEVTHHGRRFRNHQDPQAREPFTNQIAFKGASFAPRATVDLKTLTTAVQHLEELTGEEVDIEEGAIAAAFQKVAEVEKEALLPTIANAQAYQLPVQEVLADYRETLQSILDAASDDCVRILAGEGKSLQESRDRVRRIQRALDTTGLATLTAARTAARQMWPALRQRPAALELAPRADRVAETLESESLYEAMDAIAQDTQAIAALYRIEYEALHAKRQTQYAEAIEAVKGTEAWLLLDQAAVEAGKAQGSEAEQAARDEMERLLAPLVGRLCETLELPAGATACLPCRATLAQMESELAASAGLKAGVLDEVRARATPPDPESTSERVRLAEIFAPDGAVLTSRAAVDAAIERLRAFLYERVDLGLAVEVE